MHLEDPLSLPLQDRLPPTGMEPQGRSSWGSRWTSLPSISSLIFSSRQYRCIVWSGGLNLVDMIHASNLPGFEHMSTQTLHFHHHVWSCGRWSGILWSVLIFSFNTAESYSWHTGRNWNYFWKFWSSLKYSMNISPNFSSKIDNSALLRVGRFHRKIFSGPSNAFIGKIFGKNILQILRTSYTEGEI